MLKFFKSYNCQARWWIWFIFGMIDRGPKFDWAVSCPHPWSKYQIYLLYICTPPPFFQLIQASYAIWWQLLFSFQLIFIGLSGYYYLTLITFHKLWSGPSAKVTTLWNLVIKVSGYRYHYLMLSIFHRVRFIIIIFLAELRPFVDLGLVVQNIVSLTSSLRSQLVKCLRLYNQIQWYFLLTKWEKLLHCKSFSHFFNKKYWHIWEINFWKFNETLTNVVVSFEQPGPGQILWLQLH